MKNTKKLVELMDKILDIAGFAVSYYWSHLKVDDKMEKSDLIAMLTEIKGIVEDYPRIMSMLNEFISQEVDEYKHMKHEPLQGEK